MKHSIYESSLVVALAFVLNLIPVSSSARNQGGDVGNHVTAIDEPSNRIDLEFGYFTCRRETFREIYGSYFDYGLNFLHRINNRWSWGLRTEFVYLHEKESVVKYWSLSQTPMVTYTLSDQSGFVPVIGAGAGLTLRNVIASLVRVGGDGLHRSGVTATQRELSVVLVGMAGLDYHLSHSIVMGGRFHFDYHPLGDPTVGDFGDTGGYHFTFRLGRKF